MLEVVVAQEEGESPDDTVSDVLLDECFHEEDMSTIAIYLTLTALILAAVAMMPLLGFFASCIAIVGGAVIGDLMLGIPFFTFLSRIQEVVPLYDLYVGLAKAPVFGLIVALAGCYHGMQVKGNSEEVGRRTTMAVVTGIFAVIVIDAFFAVFFTEVGWG